jgi:TatD DNase family protein
MIDSHCHLNDPNAFPDPAATVRECAEAGVRELVVIGVDLESSRRAVELAERFPEVWATVGHHPNYAASFEPSLIATYREMLAHPRVVALGEIGFDDHWDFATPAQQAEAFALQMELARETGMPVVFHCREAEEKLLGALEGTPAHPAVWHCFGGDAAVADRALAWGCYLGVDGPLTYKKSDASREIFRSAPRERVLIETDAPYLSPVPHRGKPNHPAYVRLVASKLAELWEQPVDEVGKITASNTLRLFSKMAPTGCTP